MQNVNKVGKSGATIRDSPYKVKPPTNGDEARRSIKLIKENIKCIFFGKKELTAE